MKKEDIHITDLYRWVNGNVPLEFYAELIIRGLFVYLLIAFGMKYMGKRITAELNRSELAAIASLAAATGLVILAPDRGLLPPVIVLIVMLGIKWLMDKINFSNEKFELRIEGHYSVLIENGVLQMHEMKQTRMSREQVFGQLRNSGIVQLGDIKRFYIEANGSFSIIKSTDKKPGLSVIPDWDVDFIKGLHEFTEIKICSTCGKEKEVGKDVCSNCHSTEWAHPVREEKQ